MKKSKDKADAGEDDESKLRMSILARRGTEKKFHCDKFMEMLLV